MSPITPSNAFKIELPDGQIVEFNYLPSEEIVPLLTNGEWRKNEAMSEKWEISLYSNASGEVLELYGTDADPWGFVLPSKEIYEIYAKKIVTIRIEKDLRICPFVMLEREDVAGYLSKGLPQKLPSTKENLVLYQMADGRILKTDKHHSYGDMFQSIEEYVLVEKEIGGEVPIVLIPGILKKQSEEPAGGGED